SRAKRSARMAEVRRREGERSRTRTEMRGGACRAGLWRSMFEATMTPCSAGRGKAHQKPTWIGEETGNRRKEFGECASCRSVTCCGARHLRAGEEEMRAGWRLQARPTIHESSGETHRVHRRQSLVQAPPAVALVLAYPHAARRRTDRQ